MRETAVKTPYLTINGRRIGRGFPVYIIAEISANHNQDLEQAIKLIEVAGNSGADAVKLQTYTPDTMTIPSTREWFRISGGTLWDGKNLYDLYAEAYTPWEWYPKLKEVAAGAEDRLLRKRGHPPDPEDGAHRQAADHFHGDGQSGGN
jgi:sialic acid synthase SpsE